MSKWPAPRPSSIHEPAEATFASLLAIVVEGSTDAIFVKDLEGRYILANGAAARQLNRPADEVLGRRDGDIFPPDAAAETIANDQRVLASGQLETYESTTRYEGTTVRYLSTKFPCRDVDGRVIGIAGIARDVTAQKDAEDALRAQRDLYEALVDGQGELGIGLAVIDGTSRRLRFVNDALCGMTGFTREELFALPSLMALLRPQQTGAAPRADGGAGNSEPVRYDTDLIEKSGARRVVELASKKFGLGGDVLVMVRDVTLEKRTRAQLMTTDRLSAVGRLAAGVAHEINNPLAFVMMNLGEIGTILDDLDASASADPLLRGALEKLRSASKEAEEGARRAATIVRDISTFSRATDEALTKFDVRDAIRSSVRLTDNTVRYRARIDLQLGEVPLVLGNEGRVAQVLVNLIVNAAQAMPESATDSSVIILRTSSGEQGRAIVEVIDNGSGIRAEHLPHVFEPFFTTKPVGVGTGLGLSVCVGIVAAMGGELTVTSAVGQGSTFRMVLPGALPSATEEPASSSSFRAAKPVGKRSRVIVVDDEPAVGKCIGRVLARDHDVEVFVKSREALARLSAAEPFDVVVCDLMMPDLSGQDLYGAAQALDPALAARFLFLTGGAVTPDSRAFVVGLGDRCLAKPVASDELRAAVDTRLRRIARRS